MGKKKALGEVSDSAEMFGVVHATYGDPSSETAAAKSALRGSIESARDHGATEEEIRESYRGR